MQKNENKKPGPHSLSVEERHILRAGGILDVEGFDETRVFASLGETTLTIGGKGLRVSSFSAESGELLVEGEIDSVVYSKSFSGKNGFISRIFR